MQRVAQAPGKTMSVSVIMAAFNAEDTIARAVSSALAQTRAVAEVIVVDDVSTDNTRAVVERLAERDPRIKLIASGVNRGPSASRNAAISEAAGEWIAVLDADDAWAPDRIEKMMAAISDEAVDVVADNQLLYDAAADQVTRVAFPVARGRRRIRPIDVFQQEIKLGAEFSYGILKPVIRKAFLQQHRISYVETARYGEDMLLLAELLLAGARAVLIPDPLYIYTTRVGDLSGATSPHSKSVPRFDLFADGIAALGRKHAEAISPDIARAMARITRRFRLEHQLNLARAKRKEQGLFAYACFVGFRPRIAAHTLWSRRRDWRVLLQAFPSRAAVVPDLEKAENR